MTALAHRILRRVAATRFIVSALFAAFVLSGAQAANATSIEYEVTIVSGNRWEYAYTITNDLLIFSLEEFTIYFDLGLFENLSVTASPVDWDPLAVQPDSVLSSDGFFDAFSLVGGLAPTGSASGFRVAFDFLGAGTPGAQRFEIVDPVTLHVIDSGQTIAIPEPSFVLLGAAVATLLGLRCRRKLASAVMLGACIATSAQAIEVTGQATVSGLQLVNSARVSRTVFEYTYQASVSNVGEDLFGVIATVRSNSPNTEIVDANVDVGDIAARSSTLSSDTFKLRHDRAVPFDAGALAWEIGARAATPSPLRLNEVRYSALPGDAPFVEIWNPGATPISLGTFRLTNDQGASEGLPASVTVAPGGFALVLFDGQTGVSGNTIHIANASFLGSGGGDLALVGPAGFAVDRVAWGPLLGGSVTQNAGGFVEDPPPGVSIARAPALTGHGPTAWTVTAPADVTPGSANPAPGVQLLIPLSGTIVAGPQVDLAWYPVPSAASYRVQLASDASFAALVSDQTVSAPQLSVPAVADGAYFWRVQALATGGAASTFSEFNEISVDSSITSPLSATAHRATRARRARQRALAPAATSAFVLLAPLSQHKDSRLLLLESQREHGQHGWAVDHGVFDPSDPADNMNCAAASIAMVNRYFGGRLSQDRIAYEVFRTRQPGPEQDLSYGGSGFSAANVVQGLTFALGAAPLQGQVTPAQQALFWNVLQQEIDAGRPIVMGATRANGQGHATVLVAYSDVAGNQRISLADPWAPGSAAGVIHQVHLSNFLARHAQVVFWVLPAARQLASDEPEMTLDSDNDGIVDFDETQRFRTSAFDPDTDGDFVGDLIDVRASVFDPQFGYALGGNASRVDIDGDGEQMELDADSDGDRCTDGQEDFSLNGDFEPQFNETHNFDELDKRCRGWIGRTTYETRFTSDPFTRIRATGRIRWTPAPPIVPGPPLPVFTASFVPQGDVTLDLFSVLGCRFSANPNRITVDQTAGQMDINYLATPPEAGGGAGTALVTSLTNCQGQTFTEVIPLIVLFTGPVPLNAAEDEIKKVERIVSGAGEITIDMEYHLEAP